MSVDVLALRLVEYPARVLRQKARPIPAVNDEVRAVAARMIEIMRAEEGIGLAAPQVGLDWRMFIADVPADPERQRSAAADPAEATDGVVVYINPVLSGAEGGLDKMEEGCLSLPDLRGDVLRPLGITINATDLQGREFTQRATGLLARCWQHEMDHLDGVLIIDRFTQQSRLKLRRQLRELERDGD